MNGDFLSKILVDSSNDFADFVVMVVVVVIASIVYMPSLDRKKVLEAVSSM